MASHAARSTAAAAPDRLLTPSEVAWLAAVPTALVTLLTILLIGPPLGRALQSPAPDLAWSSWAIAFNPEPVEQGRFLVALTAPLLLVALTVAGVRRRLRMAPETIGVAIVWIQAAVLAFVVTCFVVQWREVFGELYSETPGVSFHRVYFTLPTLAVAALATAGLIAGMRRTELRERASSWLRETGAKRVVAPVAAALLTGIWLLHGLYTETTVALAHDEVYFHLQFPLDEAFAVLDGRTPLVDSFAQYGSLWPYPLALAMSVLGTSVGVWTGLSLALTGAALLAMYAVLRRVARSAIGGLLLFAPFLATGFFMIDGPPENRYTFGNYFGTFPLRYAGPFLLAWLIARQLDGARPRKPFVVFLVAGLCVLNNADTGIPALAAALAALLWAGGRPTRARLAHLLLTLAGGLAAAFALVSLLTLARTGSLPDPAAGLHFVRLFAGEGFGLMPMRPVGLHLVLYLTFVGAIGVATVRAIAGETDRLLTGMLAFTGVFGLGTSAYFAGRSHPESLIALFPSWALALALLTVIVVRTLAARPSRLPSIAASACLFGFFLTACSLAQTPTPWSQVQRLQETTEPVLAEPIGQAFVERYTRPGERVAILVMLGHRIAHNLDLDNVSPYASALSMPARAQLDDLIDALRSSGGRKVFLTPEHVEEDMQLALAAAGYRLAAQESRTAMQLWVDTR